MSGYFPIYSFQVFIKVFALLLSPPLGHEHILLLY
jgi:hypothetical protein